MAYDFAHDPLRESLNRASANFLHINAEAFDKVSALGIEFLHLRSRLKRVTDPVKGYMNKSLDSTDNVGMLALASDLMVFLRKARQSEYASLISHKLTIEMRATSVRDPSLDEWDEDIEGD